MKSNLALGALVAVLAATSLTVTPARGHGHHTTLTEISFCPERQTLEVSLLVADDDLRRALDDDGRGSLEDRSLAGWLRSCFKVESPQGRLRLRWVGREESRRGHWLHFEVLGVKTLTGTTLTHEVLLATEPFAFHTVKLLRPGALPLVSTLDSSHRRLDMGAAARQRPLSRNVKDRQESSGD